MSLDHDELMAQAVLRIARRLAMARTMAADIIAMEEKLGARYAAALERCTDELRKLADVVCKDEEDK